MPSFIAKLSLAVVGVGSSVGLGAFGIHYIRKSTNLEESGGTVKDFFTKRGFSITDQTDIIWEEEFEEYRKLGSRAEFNKEINSVAELKNKCEEIIGQKFEESMLTEASPSRFRFVFASCVGKTPFLVALEKGGIVRRKLDVSSDEELWVSIATKNSSESFASKIGAEGNNLEGEQWKQKIKDYCTKANWNQELRRVKDDSPIFVLCTTESNPKPLQSSPVKKE